MTNQTKVMDSIAQRLCEDPYNQIVFVEPLVEEELAAETALDIMPVVLTVIVLVLLCMCLTPVTLFLVKRHLANKKQKALERHKS